MKSLTLNRIRNTNIGKIYEKLLLQTDLTKLEFEKLLSLAVIFINETDENVSRFGYRILVFYCNYTKDYRPLYDIALNMGIIPLVKLIENVIYDNDFKGSFFRNFYSSFGENYKKNNLYLTEQQLDLFAFFEEKKDETISIIAPTSYGKSKLMISTLSQNQRGNVLILVPTKALVAQTKKEIIHSDLSNIHKVITHPEMYMFGEEEITAVLTQERLLRLLQKEPSLCFDIVFVDEAHNLLEDDDRNVLLAMAISFLEKRNNSVVFKFLTPFLKDSSNLKIRYTNYSPNAFHITEYIKTERLYLYDFRTNNPKLKIYDQFLNCFFYNEKETYKDDIDLILKECSEKNILYLNKPSDIEEVSVKLSSRLNNIASKKLEKACKDLSEYLHADYFLINCIKKGLIYHHGSVPDNIRVYIEQLFSDLNELKYVVTSSTLLEGINLPIDKMFILDNKKGMGNLSPSQFKNLIGRVCRFNELFSNNINSLEKLEPNIFLVVSNYFSRNANIESFITNCMKVDKKVKDKAKNVLLENVEIVDDNLIKKENAEEFMENFEKGSVDDYKRDYAQTEIGLLCFANNIKEINIIHHEEEMQLRVDKLENIKINTTEGVFELFSNLCLPFIDNRYENLCRLSNIESQRFYKMFLNWRINNTSYREMISNFLRYWKKVEMNEDPLVYVGRWGDKTRNGFKKLWVNIKEKGQKQRVNLAIVRIKDEQDFLENIFMKFIEVFNDLNLLDSDFYAKIKYGTKNKLKITLIKNGFSSSLANLIVNKYIIYTDINVSSNTLKINPQIINLMRLNRENEILINEVKFNTKLNS